jgi:hypothetical protein
LIFQSQLAALEFRQCEIGYGRMSARFGEFVIEQPMPLWEHSKVCRGGHEVRLAGRMYSLTKTWSGEEFGGDWGI